MIFKFFAAALTGVGGHYLNKRWDKAMLFFCLFLFYAVALAAMLYYGLSSGVVPPTDAPKQVRLYALAFSAGIVGLWMLSIIVTMRDSRSYRVATIKSWTLSGVIAALFTTLLSTICLVTAVLAFNTAFNPARIRTLATDQDLFLTRHNFYPDQALTVDKDQTTLLTRNDSESDADFSARLKKGELNRKKLAAVSLLIEETLFAEAQTVLDRVDSAAAGGERELLLGTIFAQQGECEKAKEMFAQAQGVNENIVVPVDYRVECK
ncbi:MAG: hypothetical protein IBX47_11655 [Desulfuromonadales bacterium]|nr:hypothetical protein [Desulfuromonadales bacterium]